AIQSLQAQTLPAWELVAVLDGCTDDSYLILSGQRDSRIRIYVSPSRHGIAYSLNKGLSVCRADLVARFDADDLCLPTRLETQVSELSRRPSLGVLGSSARIIDENSRVIGFRAAPRGPRRI